MKILWLPCQKWMLLKSFFMSTGKCNSYKREPPTRKQSMHTASNT